MNYTPYSPREYVIADSATPSARPTVSRLRAGWWTQALSGLRGSVLDVGAGDADSLSYLTGDVRLTCLEPHRASARQLRRTAADRPRVRVLEARAEAIPLDDATMDAAICSAVLCSVSDQERALGEIHRVLRPGGRLVLLEHVAAPRGTWLRRAQRLAAPASRWLDRGCDPARDTETALERSAFKVVELDRLAARGPWGVPIPHLTGVLTREPGPA